MSTLRGAQVAHFMTLDVAPPPKIIHVSKEKPMEMVANPQYDACVAKDQPIRKYLLSSLSHDVLLQVATLLTAIETWAAIEAMCASKSRARVINTHMALATAQMGNNTITKYCAKMKALANDMASAGKRLEDEDLASYILSGLDAEFDPIVSVVAAQDEPISLGELYSQLFGFEQRMNPC